ncbi:MAG: hypothetical protein ACLP01_16510 [Solirubrobacteraceae bacterium]
MSLPAVGVGLDLDERVIRRHVAKLEAAGWLAREPWNWGEGSVAWLTSAGIGSAGLGGVRPVKSPPGATTIAHGVLVGWSAARVEHRRRVWKSARELAIEPERWAVRARCERGYTELLPDLAVWLKRSEPPVAVIAESGGRREDRQKMILDGWRDAIVAGRYAGVRYDCANASVECWINRLARKVRLTAPAFFAAEQASAEEIAALPPAADDVEELPMSEPQPSVRATPPCDGEVLTAPVRAPFTPARVQPERAAPPAPEPETPEAAAERERRYREIFGIPEPGTRRRWRR